MVKYKSRSEMDEAWEICDVLSDRVASFGGVAGAMKNPCRMQELGAQMIINKTNLEKF
jgi:hypothetical protein